MKEKRGGEEMNNSYVIEEQIGLQSTISEALEAMREYKCWSDSTFSSYCKDVIHFEEFLSQMKLDPVLQNGKLHFIQKWIKAQREEGVASTTIKRRIASLSSIFSFYRDLGVVQQNCFKAVEVPVGHQEHHSPILEMEQLKQVYRYAEELPREQSYISPTIKMLIFTGLRNEALTNLQVKHVNFEKSLLYLNYGTQQINSKHKVQIIPLPPKLLRELEQHVQEHHLHPEDKLLFGIAGLPLSEKALNRLTDRISRDLGWTGEQRVTPHGYRATISTILSERGVDLTAIKFLLGHSEQDNLQFYIRRYGRHIRLLQKELTRIEEELLQSQMEMQETNPIQDAVEKKTEKKHFMLPKEVILKLLETDPELAVMSPPGYN